MKNFTLFTYLTFTLLLFNTEMYSQCNAGNTVTTFPYNENFETGSGAMWNQSGADDINWTRNDGWTPSNNTGPAGGSNGDFDSFYMYTEASGNNNSDAIIDTPCFDLTGATTPAFTFDYHMMDTSGSGNMGRLRVQISLDNGTTFTDTSFDRSGHQGNNWLSASIDITAYIGQTIKFRFFARTGNGYRSDIAIDNITCSIVPPSYPCINTVSTFPYNESFEGSGSGGLGLWEQPTTDDGNWTINSGGTPTAGTGPVGAADGTYYLYTEASNLSTGDNVFLDSPCFDVTGMTHPEFTFSYHRHGEDGGTVYIGPLTVRISTNGGYSYTDLITYTGQQHGSQFQPWNTEILDLVAYAGQTIKLRFDAERLGASYSDISIDNMILVDNPPTPEIAVFGNFLEIVNGDTTPSALDDTSFGDAGIGTGTGVTQSFIIENQGNADLLLTGAPLVDITGVDAADFTVTTSPNSTITPTGVTSSTTVEITFTPTAGLPGIRTAEVSIANDDSDENPYTFAIEGNAVIPSPEIEVTGNSTEIVSGDTTPDPSDNTDFGNTGVGFTTSNSFVIQNTGTDILSLTGASPYITITGPDSSLFSVSASDIPSNTIAIASAASFTLEFTPTSGGTKNATITIFNDDLDENPYTFDITGNGVTPDPEIAVFGNSMLIADGTTTTSINNNTFYGNTALGSQLDKQFVIENQGAGDLLLTGASPHVTLSNNTHFFISVIPASTINPTSTTTFFVAFKPTSLGAKYATVTISNNDSDEGSYSFLIRGDCVPSYTESPGGVNSDLQLWFKGNEGLPTTDGALVNRWETQAAGDDAEALYNGQQPTYKDNPTDNINFNPVVDFDNDRSSLTPNYGLTNVSTQFLYGTSGFYTQDVFMVIVPDETIDQTSLPMYVFCGDQNRFTNENDATGFALGSASVRFDNEVVSFLEGSSTIATRDGYGVTDNGAGTTFSNISILNSRNNSSNSQQELFSNDINIETAQNDIPSYPNLNNANNSRFFIGRNESVDALTNAKIAEIITYSARKSDGPTNSERNRIMSYLALKYGITLGVNGTSHDYADSSGNPIWDVSTNVGYNYDIAGIGRDDNSGLYQKQSKSINSEFDVVGETRGLITMGIGDIYDTNSLNPSTCQDRTFLTWGNNNAHLGSGAINVTVDISSGVTGLTTPVEFEGIQRIWKVIENGGDMPTVKIRIPENAVRGVSPPGDFIMLVSDNPTFDRDSEFALLNSIGGGLLETSYNFSGIKYITFGYAPKVIDERSLYFDGTDDYIAMNDVLDLNPTGFTISAWIKLDNPAGIGSILSKRNSTYTNGFDFNILADGRLEMSWGPSGGNRVTGNTPIPDNIWHHVAVIFDPAIASGDNTRLYIDGVEDNTRNFPAAPINTDYSFRIGASGTDTISTFFKGNIDEVRFWDTSLSVDQLRYVMNQEIEQDGTKANGKVMPQTISKNDISPIDWSLLASYQPMSTYVYLNTEGASTNRLRGALMGGINTIDRQTAPLPYYSINSGDWDSSSTWIDDSSYFRPTGITTPGDRSLVDSNITVDWNIVKTQNNITMNNTSLLNPIAPVNIKKRSLLGLIVENSELKIERQNLINPSDIGSGLEITHYLKLDGKIDLDGDSQLVQIGYSDFDPTSSGTLEKDQQGTYNLFTYNHWSSPVGTSNNTSNNNDYTIANTLKDGTDPDNLQNISFIGGYNGTNGSPIGIADYWIWKYSNDNGTYTQWQHARSTGTILAGEGYTMKGVDGSLGSESSEQNYAFVGKPNSGVITLPIAAGNSYLIGNPYPSAIDATSFINDNTGTTGVIYIWQHWGGGSHSLGQYQGGYATYSLSGGVAATSHPDVSGTGSGTKIPENYIPVSQGFFVEGGATNSTIRFRNTQRVLVKEAPGESVFIRQSQNRDINDGPQSSDKRLKLRLGLISPQNYKAQLLVTVDSNATMGVDWGYDALEFGSYPENMYWIIEDGKYTIQGINEITKTTILPIGLHTVETGISSFKIDALNNAPNDMELYIHDKETDVYHNLKLGQFDIFLNAGHYLDRFEITFSNTPILSNDDIVSTSINTYYNNANNTLVINNPESKNIDSVRLINILGQDVFAAKSIKVTNYTELNINKLSTGVYTIKLESEGYTLTKKVIVE